MHCCGWDRNCLSYLQQHAEHHITDKQACTLQGGIPTTLVGSHLSRLNQGRAETFSVTGVKCFKKGHLSVQSFVQ